MPVLRLWPDRASHAVPRPRLIRRGVGSVGSDGSGALEEGSLLEPCWSLVDISQLLDLGVPNFPPTVGPFVGIHQLEGEIQ